MGRWYPEENKTLTEYVEKYGARNWKKIAQDSGLLDGGRNGDSCYFRWTKYLKPGRIEGKFTKEEDEIIIKSQSSYENQWARIASELPGRTDNDIKNRWNTHLSKKKVVSKEDGIPNHSEIHQNISNELFPSYEFPHPNSFNEHFSELDSNQYLPTNPFPEKMFSPIRYSFLETCTEPEYLPEPLLENKFQLWDGSTTFTLG